MKNQNQIHSTSQKVHWFSKKYVAQNQFLEVMPSLYFWYSFWQIMSYVNTSHTNTTFFHLRLICDFREKVYQSKQYLYIVNPSVALFQYLNTDMAIQTGLQRYLFLLFCKNIFKFRKVLPIDFQIPELANNFFCRSQIKF